MQFKISTQEFNYLINRVQNVVSPKPPMPLLGNLLIEAYNDELIVTATDLTVGIRCFGEATIIEEGSTTLPAKRLAQLVREMTHPVLEISVNPHEVTQIIAGTSRFKINGMSQSEFPDLPALSEAFRFTLTQKDFKDLLHNTSFACSREDNRYMLTGILMEIADNRVTFVGTDGKRMAKTYTTLQPENSDVRSRSIIPLKAAEEITKNLLEEGTVTVSVMPDKIGIETDQILIVAKLLSGDYPDIGRVIPEKSNAIVLLHREELTSLLRQISLFTSDNHHSVRFSFNSGELTLSANTADIGEGHVSMPANYQTDKTEIALNPGFFLDILRHCKEEIISMAITDAYNPVIVCDGDQTENLLNASPLYVIMPMRLSED